MGCIVKFDEHTSSRCFFFKQLNFVVNFESTGILNFICDRIKMNVIIGFDYKAIMHQPRKLKIDKSKR